MNNKLAQVGAAVILSAAVTSFAIAQAGGGQGSQGQTGDPQTQITQGARPLTIARSNSAISVDERYVYILTNGQLSRIEKKSGISGGWLTNQGWSGTQPAAPVDNAPVNNGTTGGGLQPPR